MGTQKIKFTIGNKGQVKLSHTCEQCGLNIYKQFAMCPVLDQISGFGDGVYILMGSMEVHSNNLFPLLARWQLRSSIRDAAKGCKYNTGR